MRKALPVASPRAANGVEPRVRSLTDGYKRRCRWSTLPEISSPSLAALVGVLALVSGACGSGAGPVHPGPVAPADLSATETPQWVELAHTNAPSGAVVSGDLVYDGADGYVVGFGMCRISGCESGVWEFRAGVWSNLSATTPDTGAGYTAAFDPNYRCVVIFLETGTGSVANRTWCYAHGAFWNLGAKGPALYQESVMAYDPIIGGEVMFGGLNASGSETNQTWVFKGGVWRETSGPAPESRHGEGMTYDPMLSAVLLFGGQGSTIFRDTWAYTPSGWQSVWSSLPTPRYETGLAYDPALAADVLFGGAMTSGNPNSTWFYSEGGWSELTGHSPPPRDSGQLVFDDADGYLVLFGGSGYAGWTNDTWVLTSSQIYVALGISVSPGWICSQSDLGCAAGVSETTVTITAVVGSSENASVGPANSSTSDYGPFEWLSDGTVTFASYGQAALDPNPDFNVTCSNPASSPLACPADPAMAQIPGNGFQLTWTWNTGSGDTSLLAGSEWQGSFRIVVRGPPFGENPVDACQTLQCEQAEPSRSNGTTSDLGVATSSASPRLNLSYPLVMVNVVGPATPTSSPPTTLPSLPPPTGPTLPAPPILSPITQPLPLPGATVLPSAAVPVSFQALAAGVIAMGFGRAVVSRVGVATPSVVPVRAVSLANTAERRKRLH